MTEPATECTDGQQTGIFIDQGDILPARELPAVAHPSADRLDANCLPTTKTSPSMPPPQFGGQSLPPVLPVIDLLGGDVVWGIAGQRQKYRPLKSPLIQGSHPVDVAHAIGELVGHNWLYVADLDAIQSDAPDWPVLQQLIDAGCKLLVDAGLRETSRAQRLVDAGVSIVVAALETLAGPDALVDLVATIGVQRAAFSLDLKAGQILGDATVWGTADPLLIADRAIRTGIGGIIVLDLAGVGSGEGVPTRDLCRKIRDSNPEVPLISGGGVRQIQDVQQLLDATIDSVLIASALHHGQITATQIASLARKPRV